MTIDNLKTAVRIAKLTFILPLVVGCMGLILVVFSSIFLAVSSYKKVSCEFSFENIYLKNCKIIFNST